MRVDIRKLDEHRSVIDECIAESAIKFNISRYDSATNILHDLGFRVDVFELDRWYHAAAISWLEQQTANRIYLRRRNAKQAALYESVCLLRRSVCATSRSDALIALIALVLDPNLDLELVDEGTLDSVFWSRSLEYRNEFKTWHDVVQHCWDDLDSYLGPDGLRRELSRV